MEPRSSLTTPMINTRVDFWPSMIDVLASLLMVFLLMYFVQYQLNARHLAAAIAQRKQAVFIEVFKRTFHNEILQQQVAFSSDLNLLQITFGEEILFERGKYKLQTKGETVLWKLVSVFQELNATPRGQQVYKQIQIEGHTDTDELKAPVYPQDNWELSTARALEVLKFLARKTVPPLEEKKMSASGYASNRPKADKAPSRRIEILIYFSGKEGRTNTLRD